MGEALSVPEGTSGNGAAGQEPSEGVLISQLIQLLSQRPKHQFMLSDLSALLSGPLKQRANQQGGLKVWLQRYPSLFLLSGPPGKESVTWILGGPAAQQQSEGDGDAPENAVGEESAVNDANQDTYASNADLSRISAEETDEVDRIKNNLEGGLHTSEEVWKESGTPPGELEQDSILPTDGNAPAFDEDVDGQSALQLRGLPYRATAEDVRTFLGEHAANLAGESPIYLVLNRDGRPSGFARVCFASPEAAKRCRDELHLRSMDDRYVEVFLYSERPSRGRQRRGGPEEGPIGEGVRSGATNGVADAAAGVTKDMVVGECRSQMADVKKRRLLLSMLGVALSNGARSYLKQMDQGLKHFLAQYPNEFSVDGGKGSEYVTYTPIQLSEAIDGLVQTRGSPGSVGATAPAACNGPVKCEESSSLHCSPKPSKCKSMDPTPSAALAATPSDWGTPCPGASLSGWPQPSNAPWVPPWPTGAGSLPGVGNGLPGGDAAAGAWAPPPAWPIPPAFSWPGWAGQFPTPWSLPGAGCVEAGAAPPPLDDGAARAAVAAANAFGGPSAALASAPQGGSTATAAPSAGTAPSGGNGTTATGNYANAVRLRGLPFSASEQDVLAFFAQHDIVDRIADGPNAVNLLLRSNGRPSGQAVVQMRGRPDAELAQRVLGGQWMGSRYIEVFLYGEDGSTETNGAMGAAGAPAPKPAPAPPAAVTATGAAKTAPAAVPVSAAPAARGVAAAGVNGVAPYVGPGGVPDLATAAAGLTPDQTAAAAMAAAAAAFAAGGGLAVWPPPASWGHGFDASQMGFAGMAPSLPPSGMENSWEALFQFLGPDANANFAALSGMPPIPPPPQVSFGIASQQTAVASSTTAAAAAV